MTYAAQNRHFAPYFAYQASPKNNAVAKKPGVLRRIFDAIVESRQKHVDREIALGLARSGALGLQSGKWQVMALSGHAKTSALRPLSGGKQTLDSRQSVARPNDSRGSSPHTPTGEG